MHKTALLFVCLSALMVSPVFAGISVSAPKNNSTVQSPVHFSATAGSTSCSKGVASMGIYSEPGLLAYVQNGTSLDTNLSLAPGTYDTTVQQWDYCGGSSKTYVTITVSSSGGGSTFSHLQESSGWETYGEYPPDYAICSSCGDGVTWSMTQKEKSPSLSGDSTKYTIGGDTPYSDVLWVNHLIGPYSTQGMPDPDQTIVPTLYNFTYDTYFYGTDLSLSENLEFDLGQFFNNTGLMFGLQCQIVNGSVWGLWDDVSNKWVPTSIPCKPLSNYWNHVTFQFQRTSSNQVNYLSVTLNGVTTNINKQYGSFKAEGWYGLVLNFQLDGNSEQSSYSVYLDNLTVTY